MTDILDLRTIADEWQELLDELGGNVPNTEGMSWGEVGEATEAFLREPEQVAEQAKYVELCEQLGITPVEPDTLRRYGNDREPTLIPDSEFEDYARELAEDIGLVEDSARWPCDCIDWERAADELRSDYSSISYDGDDYLMRA